MYPHTRICFQTLSTFLGRNLSLLTSFQELYTVYSLGVHNLFANAGRITFDYLNHDRQFKTLLFLELLLLCFHTQSSLFPNVCLSVFLLGTSCSRKRVFINARLP